MQTDQDRISLKVARALSGPIWCKISFVIEPLPLLDTLILFISDASMIFPVRLQQQASWGRAVRALTIFQLQLFANDAYKFAKRWQPTKCVTFDDILYFVIKGCPHILPLY